MSTEYSIALDITESTGPSWVTPIYNHAGKMTIIPKPADPTVSFTGKKYGASVKPVARMAKPGHG
jgi:hypothetical protein